MEDFSAHCQEILKPTLGKSFLADAHPKAENPIAAQDGAVFVGDNQATRGTVEKILEVGSRRLINRHLCLPRAEGSCPWLPHTLLERSCAGNAPRYLRDEGHYWATVHACTRPRLTAQSCHRKTPA